ncbi:unnamed protein product [Amaranthus hypochondriacus]
MALPIKKLSQITEETGLFIIKAKVIYAWKSIEDGGKGTALHMLLLDEESTTIQATIAHYNYNQFGSRIIEGSTYSLSNFKLFNVNLMVGKWETTFVQDFTSGRNGQGNKGESFVLLRFASPCFYIFIFISIHPFEFGTLHLKKSHFDLRNVANSQKRGNTLSIYIYFLF